MSGVIYLRLANGGLRFCLDQAGYSYLTPGNMMDFLLRPWTAAVLLGIGALTLLLVTVEIGGLVTIYSGTAYSLRPGLPGVIAAAVKRTLEQLRRRNFRLFGAAAVWALLIHLFYLVRAVTHARPFLFIMRELEGSRLARYGAALGLAACLIWALPLVFVFHECMLEKRGWKNGTDCSRRLWAAGWRQTAGCLLLIHAAVVGGAVLLYLAAVTLAVFLADPFIAGDLELAFLMEASRRIEAAVAFLAIIASMAAHFAAVSVLRADLKGETLPCRKPQRETGTENPALFLILLVLLAAGCLFDAAYNGNYFGRAVSVETTITAHRGSSLQEPENTLAAVRAAMEQMADRVEIDVQETADGVLVVYHDRNLNRLTGRNRRIQDMTYEELEEIRIGNERIPSLEQVMNLAKGQIDLNIELKNTGNDSRMPEKVLELIRRYDMMSQCVVSSVNRSYLERLKELDEEIQTGYVVSAAYGRPYDDEAIDFLSIRSDFVTAGLVQAAHEAGRMVCAWTVNDRMELERLRALNVDDVITDDPVLAREVLFREEVGTTVVQYLRMLLK